jgi:winged helix DNA-binding protein
VPAPEAQLGWPDVLAFRLARHFLHPRGSAPIRDVVAALCGLQAQVFSAAELTLQARTDQVARGDLARALWRERSLVKTWAMRGTLHVLPADELPMWLAPICNLDAYSRPAWVKYFGLRPGDIDRILDAVARALEGEPLTRAELAARVTRLTRSRRLGDKLLMSWGMMLKPAAYSGLLCFAEGEGARVRFTRPPAAQPPAEPAREVARRFLAASGPVTVADLVRWWGVRAAVARRALGDDVAHVEIEGTPAVMLRRDLPELGRARRAERVVRLLPAFDQYTITASRHADKLLPAPELRARVYRTAGWLSPILLVGGRMAGVWRHEAGAVTLSSFATLPAWARRAAGEEAERLAAFLGRPLQAVRVE